MNNETNNKEENPTSSEKLVNSDFVEPKNKHWVQIFCTAFFLILSIIIVIVLFFN